jgi:beta-phosphoglucomutase-like phosphatase (HAD superfamily)
MKLAIPDREFGGYIFDCDGTLADTMPLHYRAWTRIAAELGGTFPIELEMIDEVKPIEAVVQFARRSPWFVLRITPEGSRVRTPFWRPPGD